MGKPTATPKRALVVLSQLALAACGSAATGTEPTAAPEGIITVTTQTTGEFPDPDGYILTVDGTDREPIGRNDRVEIGVPAGEHSVGLGSIAANCAATPGPSDVRVTVAEQQTVTVSFMVTCPKPQVGSIAVVIQTQGTPQDPDGYSLDISGVGTVAVSTQDTVTVGDVTPGTVTIALSGQASNCVPSGGPLRTVSLSANGTATRATFTIKCFDNPILFERSVGTTDIWLVEGNGSVEVNVTDGAGDNRLEYTGAPGASWSADHEWILFVSDRDGDWDIYTARINKSALRHYDLPGNQVEAAWSRDGAQIAYVTDESGNLDVWTMDTNGVAMNRVSKTAFDERYPTWSPSGDNLTYMLFEDPYRETYIANSDGSGNPVNLTNAPRTGAVTHDYFPYWSSDGSTLAFRRVTFDSVTHTLLTDDIYSMAPDGSGLLNITERPTQSPMLRVAWNPTMPELAVIQCDGLVPSVGQCELRLLPNTGGVGTAVATIPFGAAAPTWSSGFTFSGPVTPATAVAYSCPNSSGGLEVCVVDVSSGTPVQVTANQAPDNLPRWQ